MANSPYKIVSVSRHPHQSSLLFVRFDGLVHRNLGNDPANWSFAPATTAAPVDASTVALWRCDEGTAVNFTDAGPNGYTLAQVSSPGVVAGVAAGTTTTGARSFTTTNQYGWIATPTAVRNLINAGTFTIEGWVRPVITSASRPTTSMQIILIGGLLSGAESDNILAQLYLMPPVSTSFTRHGLRFVTSRGLGLVTATDPFDIYTDNEWLHWAVTSIPTTGTLRLVKIYANGIEVGRQEIEKSTGGGGVNDRIMISSSSPTIGLPLFGDLDDIHISNVERTPEEILATFRNGTPQRPILITAADAELSQANTRGFAMRTPNVMDGVEYTITVSNLTDLNGDDVVAPNNSFTFTLGLDVPTSVFNVGFN